MSELTERATVIPMRRGPERVRLGKRAVEKLEPPCKGRRYVYDTERPGLAICVTANGSKTWYYVKKITGKTTRVRLGAFPELSVENARKLSESHAADVAQGKNPHKERKRLRSGMTLRELFEHWLEEYATIHKRPVSIDEDKGLFHRFLEQWANRRLHDIQRSDVRTLHKTIGKHNGRYSANRMLSLLQTVFQHAIDEDDVDFRGDNPAKGVRRFEELSRERFLQPDEMPKFIAAVEADANPDVRDYFMLALWTGARCWNLRSMRWADLHLDRATWEPPKSKTGALKIHLPAPAVEILKRRKDAAEPGAEWVFPASRKGTKEPFMAYPQVAWKRIQKRSGLHDLRPHDLRRSLGSWQAAGGASLGVIGKSLGHSRPETTAIYARLDLDPVRQSVDVAVAAMLEAAKGGGDG